MSCYIPAFTSTHSRLQQAACGRFVFDREHSNEPDCPKCAAWLVREADDEATLFESLGYVELRPGVMGPAPSARKGPPPIVFGSKPEP